MDKTELLEYLKRAGFSKKIVDAFSSVNREDFVPPELEEQAYENTALPIGEGQTISQPYTIAIMLSELKLRAGQKVLEVGSGSGYVLALISKIIGKRGRVYGIEIIKKIADKSKKALVDFKNVRVYNRNGYKGLPEETPFDRILISAACREIPQPLLNQLKDGGLLVAPQGSRFEQDIVVMQRKGNEFLLKTRIPGFIFVPLVEETEQNIQNKK
ncbi:MAG: protein-L-isoaspartate O-methyltransferase [Candidatus Pacearchaeota archaeon]